MSLTGEQAEATVPVSSRKIVPELLPRSAMAATRLAHQSACPYWLANFVLPSGVDTVVGLTPVRLMPEPATIPAAGGVWIGAIQFDTPSVVKAMPHPAQ